MVLLSHIRGIVTESQRIGSAAGATEQYLIRSHKADAQTSLIDMGLNADRLLWTGFRYRDGHWSFSELPSFAVVARDGQRCS